MDRTREHADKDLVVLESVGSTNEELMSRARAGAPHGMAIRARTQTAGRGRRSHNWASPDGGLYLSILLRPALAPTQLPGIPVACGLGVVRALESLGCADLALKWPNDVIAPAGKLGGILVEAVQTTQGMAAVCGCGINFSLPDAGARTKGALPITCLADALSSGCTMPDIDHAAKTIRSHVLETYESWARVVAREGEGAPPLFGIVEDYNRLVAYSNEKVKILSPQQELLGTGTLNGIDPWGRAIVVDQDGKTLALDSAHASLRPLACD